MSDEFAQNSEGEEVRAPMNGQDTKMALAKRMIENLKSQLENLERLLDADMEPADLEKLVKRHRTQEGEVVAPAAQGRQMEGVFDGEHMIGEDGQKYLVPPNYASKSKLVEGDLLRLTITDAGRFLFKQKGPIERQRLMGMLIHDDQTNDWFVAASGQKYRVLAASISFFKGQHGDDVVILVPKNAPSKWAAVENIVKRDLPEFET